ncbi:MAG TPA: hypothetical protein VFX70_03930 [Mycobacteriales bacterium]|nr:hypothetical protein [Mycobacteriales bacterium]
MTAPDCESTEETLAIASDPEMREAIRRGLRDVEQADIVDFAEARRMLDRPQE